MFDVKKYILMRSCTLIAVVLVFSAQYAHGQHLEMEVTEDSFGPCLCLREFVHRLVIDKE
jgi:hypothetical protein